MPATGCVLVANLPYNVATALVVGVLEDVPAVSRMLVMVQREVGERLVAPAGSRTYGALSVRVAYFADRPAGRPRVSRGLLSAAARHLGTRRDRAAPSAPAVDPGEATYDEIDFLLRAGFAQRRKMLRRSLAGLVEDEAFASAGISPTARAEDLDIAAWGKLAGCRRSIGNLPTRS